MLVYRIERKNFSDVGPYTGGFNHEKCNAYDHPSPWNDGIGLYTDIPGSCIDEKREWFCGFESMNQLKNWFDEEDRIVMHHMGFIISVYRVDVQFVRIGGHQVMFKMDEGNVEETMLLDNRPIEVDVHVKTCNTTQMTYQKV